MENPIKVVKIDGFINMSLSHVECCICKYAVCAKCVDLFSLNHECKYKYFNESMIRKKEEYICYNCVNFFEIKEEQKNSKKKRKNSRWSDNIHAICVECKEHMYYDSRNHIIGNQHICDKCKK